MKNRFITAGVLCFSLIAGRGANAQVDDPTYEFNNTTYAMDFPFGHYQGQVEGSQDKCNVVIKEGQELMKSFTSGPYKNILVPEAVLIDSFLKLKSLVFAFDLTPSFEGSGGLMSAHEKVTTEGLYTADFLRANNRTLIAVLPESEKLRAVKVIKGAGLCNSTSSYASLPKLNVTENNNNVQIAVLCGGEETAAITEWTMEFEKTTGKSYLLKPKRLSYKVSVGEPVQIGDGYYRPVNDRKKIISYQCSHLKKLF